MTSDTLNQIKVRVAANGHNTSYAEQLVKEAAELFMELVYEDPRFNGCNLERSAALSFTANGNTRKVVSVNAVTTSPGVVSVTCHASDKVYANNNRGAMLKDIKDAIIKFCTVHDIRKIGG